AHCPGAHRADARRYLTQKYPGRTFFTPLPFAPSKGCYGFGWLGRHPRSLRRRADARAGGNWPRAPGRRNRLLWRSGVRPCLLHQSPLAEMRLASEFADRYLASFRALIAAYLAGVSWEDPAALEKRAARLLAMLLLARVDGKS